VRSAALRWVWKPGAAPEQITAAMASLPGLKTQIPGIVSLNCGADFSGRAQGYTHALVIRFADRAAFDAYGPHPAHQALIEMHLRPILAEVLDFDFEPE